MNQSNPLVTQEELRCLLDNAEPPGAHGLPMRLVMAGTIWLMSRIKLFALRG